MDSLNSSQAEFLEGDEEVSTCKWGNCAENFPSVQLLGQHLSDIHVGKKQSSYTCEWQDCLRNGEPLPNRFALVAHLRRHTGERPYKCIHCSRSFSRSDALSKHVKAQHGDTSATVINECTTLKASPASPNKISTKLRRKLEFLESERAFLVMELYSSRTKIKRLRAEKLLLLDSLLMQFTRQNSINLR